jgi:hypothetical protein
MSIFNKQTTLSSLLSDGTIETSHKLINKIDWNVKRELQKDLGSELIFLQIQHSRENGSISATLVEFKQALHVMCCSVGPK